MNDKPVVVCLGSIVMVSKIMRKKAFLKQSREFQYLYGFLKKKKGFINI